MSKTDVDYDIMIVGGGPAGISTWLHLHKYAPELASRSVLIEKAVYPRDKLCGGGAGGWCRQVLKNLNVDLDIPILTISDVEFIYENDRFLLHQPNSFQMIQRLEFDYALAKTAISRGLNLHQNESFLDLNERDNKLIVKTNLDKYKIKTIVGADGALSLVRRKMKLKNKTNLAPTLKVFVPANPKYDHEYDEKKIVIDMNPIKIGMQGYIWHVPTIKNGVPTIGHGLVDLRIYQNRPKVNLKEIFRQELRRRNIHIEQKKWRSHPIRWPSTTDKFSKNNTLLVGDAIGAEPAFGGGIHFALSYGEIAAKSIINAFENNDFTYSDYKERINSHFAGKFMAKCSEIAFKLYDNKIDPIEAAKEVFTIKK